MYTLVSLALGKRRQEDFCRLEVSLKYSRKLFQSKTLNLQWWPHFNPAPRRQRDVEL